MTGPETAAVADAQRLVDELAPGMGEQPAVHLVHAGAVAAHAAAAGLIAATGDLRGDLSELAALHPSLQEFLHLPGSAGRGDVQHLWQRHPVIEDHPHRRDGHFLGDVYQLLSTEARKGRALCQTPAWVTRLLLDIAFDRAYEARGPHVAMIDPGCGTGHILIETLIHAGVVQDLGLCRSSRDATPRLPMRTGPLERAHAALNTVHGVDLDPYAALVTRYRLLVCAVLGLKANRHAPTAAEISGLPLHVAAADSLLAENEPLLTRGRYDVVIANPPYITCKDAKTNAAVRARYPQVCNGKFSLALPFHALMTELLSPGGWCAQITANSFMKREFGQRYVERFLTGLDLYWVIDTSGAYIPGHGTPTVILANRNQPPSSNTIATVRGVHGEPSVPADPARGKVWRAIEDAVDQREAMARLAAAIEREYPTAQPAETPRTPIPAGSYTQPTLFDLLDVA